MVEFSQDLFSCVLDIDGFFNDLKEVFESDSVNKVVYDYKDVKKLLLKRNIILNNCFDVALAKYLLEANDKKQTLKQFSSEMGYDVNYAACLISTSGELIKKLKIYHFTCSIVTVYLIAKVEVLKFSSIQLAISS